MPFGLDKGEIWVTSLAEMKSWYDENAGEVEDWELRLAQLLGVPDNGNYTHFTAFWAYPEDAIRPAYVTDTGAQMKNDYQAVPEGEYKEWFDNNIIYSYFESEYPWTRLGYTYDWSAGESDYGLTEFLIFDGSRTETVFTCTTDEFVSWLDSQPDNSN